MLYFVFRNKFIFLAPLPTPSRRITPCLSTAAYSIYSQLPSIVGGRSSIPQPEDAPCCGDRDPPNMDVLIRQDIVQGRNKN
jgi:hypothetical protein